MLVGDENIVVRRQMERKVRPDRCIDEPFVSLKAEGAGALVDGPVRQAVRKTDPGLRPRLIGQSTFARQSLEELLTQLARDQVRVRGSSR